MNSRTIKGMLRVIGLIVLLVIILAALVVAYLTVDEFNPAETEALDLEGKSSDLIAFDTGYNITTWNIGYGGLGDNADFFMDGGKQVTTATKDRVYENLNAIISEIESLDSDFLYMQEIDRSSTRSSFINEIEYLAENSNAKVFSGMHSYARNFKVSFIPYPIPPIGKVESGLATFSKYKANSSMRVRLPSPFSWPVSTVNLKRCLNVTRCPIEGSDKELVLVNLHLEAYDDGTGKVAQTNMLKDVLLREVEAGNYVIAGGDFNQVFSSVDSSKYPEVGVGWKPGYIDDEDFGDELTFYTDPNAPTCRSLERVLADAESKDPQDFPYFVIDGFLVSSNVKVNGVTNGDLGFKNSDHNPVTLSFELPGSED